MQHQSKGCLLPSLTGSLSCNVHGIRHAEHKLIVFTGPFISQLLKTQFDRLSFLHNSCFRKTVRVGAQGMKPASLCVSVGLVWVEASICWCHCG